MERRNFHLASNGIHRQCSFVNSSLVPILPNASLKCSDWYRNLGNKTEEKMGATGASRPFGIYVELLSFPQVSLFQQTEPPRIPPARKRLRNLSVAEKLLVLAGLIDSREFIRHGSRDESHSCPLLPTENVPAPRTEVSGANGLCSVRELVQRWSRFRRRLDLRAIGVQIRLSPG